MLVIMSLVVHQQGFAGLGRYLEKKADIMLLIHFLVLHLMTYNNLIIDTELLKFNEDLSITNITVLLLTLSLVNLFHIKAT